MKKLIGDLKAATPTFEYIILIGILMVYLAIFIALYSGEIELSPYRTATQSQFEDVGNDISSNVVDMYVIAPESGYLKTRFTVPQAVGKYEYKVEFEKTGVNDHILVSALRFDKEVVITLNKIDSSLELNGSIYSASPEHWLVYNSTGGRQIRLE